jgi:hypothetical protein
MMRTARTWPQETVPPESQPFYLTRREPIGLAVFRADRLKYGMPSMPTQSGFELFPIGYVRSSLQKRKGAPRQGWEGAPAARLEVLPEFIEALDGVLPGQEIWPLTWLHESDRAF